MSWKLSYELGWLSEGRTFAPLDIHPPLFPSLLAYNLQHTLTLPVSYPPYSTL